VVTSRIMINWRTAGFVAAATCATVLSVGVDAEAQECAPPRILFVVDASSSMLAEIEDPSGTTTKWAGAVTAVESVLAAYPNAAQYGLMTFPGAAGQCSIGEVEIDVATGTGPQIVQALGGKSIPANNQTPAGQTLASASSYPLITDPGYANHVIFVTDGYQYCSVANGTACATQSDCTLMGVGSCPSCLPDANDGCFCIQDWTVLGAEDLASQGVDTFVVGFGEQVNFQALNQTAVAGNTALPGCDPTSTTASCYYQASQPTDLQNALSNIVTQVVTESCVGPCGIDGSRTCGVDGWSDCDAPAELACTASCGLAGVQTCVNDTLGNCSSEAMCGGGGMGGTPGVGGGMGTGGIGGNPSTPPGDDDGDVIEEDGGCGCRVVGPADDTNQAAWFALFGLVGAGLRRRRSRRPA
jgi:MYXO-CTERM domain-containing protein